MMLDLGFLFVGPLNISAFESYIRPTIKYNVCSLPVMEVQNSVYCPSVSIIGLVELDVALIRIARVEFTPKCDFYSISCFFNQGVCWMRRGLNTFAFSALQVISDCHSDLSNTVMPPNSCTVLLDYIVSGITCHRSNEF